MTRYLFLCFLLFAILSFQLCDNSGASVTPVESDFNYPLTVGNQWTYQIKIQYSDFQPDSIGSLIDDYSGTIFQTITRDTILDSTEVYELKEESDDSDISYSYLANENDGLFQYAYGLSDVDNLIQKANSTSILGLNNIRLRNGSVVFTFSKNTKCLSKAAEDSIVLYEEPYIIYAYPLTIGKEWDCLSYLSKEVVGKVNIETACGTFECFKIKWNYLSEIYSNIDYYEYLGQKGLIKIVYTIDDIYITTIEKPEGIGQADVKYTCILTDVNF